MHVHMGHFVVDEWEDKHWLMIALCTVRPAPAPCTAIQANGERDRVLALLARKSPAAGSGETAEQLRTRLAASEDTLRTLR
jgi:hypothetical protein